MIPVLLLLVALLIFVLLNLSKADPILGMMPAQYTQEDYDAMAARFGLDKPFIIQYFNWVKNAATGDLGLSYKTKTSVSDDIFFRVPISLKLAFFTTLVMIVIGIPLGVMCAVKQYTMFDNIVNVLAKFMGAIPGFWLGLMLIIIFGLNLKIFPVFGIETAKSWVMPIFTLLLPYLANYIRQVRSAMLDCIRQDYVRTARSKGAGESRVIFRDTLKNALLPIITFTGGIFIAMMGGAVIVERVFAIPGIGNKIVDSINHRDIPTLLACTMILSVFTIIMQIVVDLFYVLVDPRIKSSFTGKKESKRVKSKALFVEAEG
jgi:peptide/nickel transport system permease protein